ncbi:hypothetical protein FN846DRAFT_889709 [Sphaerosporella brunnea]|uniref:Uncharacterized protein n=1 Tax=Sphaerosporella brunnea TaxID=1250544 RepID=A0A5J5EYF4_9PEZI|nr:hypothetical protein FN846DRAFT_889709 [Sphaerosporella brunnea]
MNFAVKKFHTPHTHTIPAAITEIPANNSESVETFPYGSQIQAWALQRSARTLDSSRHPEEREHNNEQPDQREVHQARHAVEQELLHVPAIYTFPGKPDDDANDDDDEPAPSLDAQDGDNHEDGHPAVDAEQFTVQKAAGEGPTPEDSPRATTNTSQPEPMNSKKTLIRHSGTGCFCATHTHQEPFSAVRWIAECSGRSDTLSLPETQTTLIIPRSTTLVSLVSRLAEYFHNLGSGYTSDGHEPARDELAELKRRQSE